LHDEAIQAGSSAYGWAGGCGVGAGGRGRLGGMRVYGGERGGGGGLAGDGERGADWFVGDGGDRDWHRGGEWEGRLCHAVAEWLARDCQLWGHGPARALLLVLEYAHAFTGWRPHSRCRSLPLPQRPHSFGAVYFGTVRVCAACSGVRVWRVRVRIYRRRAWHGHCVQHQVHLRGSDGVR